MAAGQGSEAIIATLEEAKVKLGEAQRHTFAGLTRLGKIRSAIEFTLGRLGRGNPAMTLLRDAEKSIKDRAVEINALSARVDKAIAEIREAAGGGGAGVPSPDPASSDTVPASRLDTDYVVPGNTPVPVPNESRGDLGAKWTPRATSEICGSTGCENVAVRIQQQIGGEQRTIRNTMGDRFFLGKYRGEDTMWKSHTVVVVKDGRVYDGFTSRYGEPIVQWKGHWSDGDILDFGF